MSKTTIEWTNYTWNPWVGCKKVSAGCKNCYMYREQTWRGNDPTLIRRTKTLNDPLGWDRKRITTGEPPWGERCFVFTCSYSDFFIREADEWRPEAWEIIRKTPHLTYQILTKRPERMKECLPPDWPLPNVWLGVSVENQKAADERIPLLLQTPAAVRFISVEPMLEIIDLNQAAYGMGKPRPPLDIMRRQIDGECLSALDWVICGCESGPGARPMELDWARSLRDQCVESGVPFFFKQSFENGHLVKMPFLDGKQYAQYPENAV